MATAILRETIHEECVIKWRNMVRIKDLAPTVSAHVLDEFEDDLDRVLINRDQTGDIDRQPPLLTWRLHVPIVVIDSAHLTKHANFCCWLNPEEKLPAD